jgi:NADPH:quinone reductase-like Zn-dependent oxidoreductase
MKAAVIASASAPPAYGDFDEPIVREGRELVQLVATGIHPIVRSLAEGRHYGSTGLWPLIPGVDAVARTADGTVVYTGFPEAPYGTLAERIAVPAFGLSLPEGADPLPIAGGLNPGLASWMPLQARSVATALETVLVLGATGMAGFLAVQNASVLGATRIVGVGRNPTGLERAARAGATVSSLTGVHDDDAASIATALDGHAPTLVLDFLWGSVAEATFAALGRRGLDEDVADIAYVQIGALAGQHASLPSALLRSRRIRISGSGAGAASISELMAQLPTYMQLISEGRVDVPIRTFPLSRAADAWIAAGKSGPRVVVVPG